MDIDWFVYWFMFPGCILIATMAMLSGISGAAMLSPVIIIGFPLLGVPTLSPAHAIGMALFTEFFGFTSGVLGYAGRGLIDYRVGITLGMVAIPSTIVASLLSENLQPGILKAAYGFLMIGLAAVLIRHAPETVRSPSSEPKDSVKRVREAKRETIIHTRYGVDFKYRLCDQRSGAVLTAIGAFMAGLISTGLGEIEMPQLVRRCKIPVPVAAATSVFIVAVTVLSGSITHLLALVKAGGLQAVPWNLVVYTVPGALIGGQMGSRFQGRVSSIKMERVIAILFVSIGIVFLLSVLRFRMPG